MSWFETCRKQLLAQIILKCVVSILIMIILLLPMNLLPLQSWIINIKYVWYFQFLPSVVYPMRKAWIKATGLLSLCSWRCFTFHPEGLAICHLVHFTSEINNMYWTHFLNNFRGSKLFYISVSNIWHKTNHYGVGMWAVMDFFIDYTTHLCKGNN